jgi:hypothetical protein
MPLHSTVLIALILLIGATVPSIAEEGANQTFTCTAKTFNDASWKPRAVLGKGQARRNTSWTPKSSSGAIPWKAKLFPAAQ